MSQREPCKPIVADEKSSEVNTRMGSLLFVLLCLVPHEVRAHDDTRQSLSTLVGRKKNAGIATKDNKQ